MTFRSGLPGSLFALALFSSLGTATAFSQQPQSSPDDIPTYPTGPSPEAVA